MNLAILLFIVVSLLPKGAEPRSAQARRPDAKSNPHALGEDDSGRISGLKLRHRPAYHTYSRWRIDGEEYILAYWDKDNELLDLHADIYSEHSESEEHPSYTRVGTIPVFERVKRVFTGDLVGDAHEELIILSEMGQLEAIRIVRMENGIPRLVLDTAGTNVRIVEKPNPTILVYARTPNQTEIFRWSSGRKQFHRVAVRSGP